MYYNDFPLQNYKTKWPTPSANAKAKRSGQLH